MAERARSDGSGWLGAEVGASNAPVYTGAACWRAAAPKPPQERTLTRPFLLSRLRRLLPIQTVKGTGRIFSAALRKSPPSSPLTVWIFAVHGPRRRRRKLRINRFRLRRKLNHCAAPPLPTKPCGCVGFPKWEQDCIPSRRQPAHCTAKPAIRGALPRTPASDKEQDKRTPPDTDSFKMLSRPIEAPPTMSCPLMAGLGFIISHVFSSAGESPRKTASWVV